MQGSGKGRFKARFLYVQVDGGAVADVDAAGSSTGAPPNLVFARLPFRRLWSSTWAAPVDVVADEHSACVTSSSAPIRDGAIFEQR